MYYESTRIHAKAEQRAYMWSNRKCFLAERVAEGYRVQNENNFLPECVWGGVAELPSPKRKMFGYLDFARYWNSEQLIP